MKQTPINEEELQKFMAQPDTQPVVMINLLQFKGKTADGEPGEKAYERYMQNVAPLLAAVGGRLLWQGQADQVLVGGPEDRWQRVLLVEYPSRAAFLKMINLPEFQRVQKDRELALERAVLIAATAATAQD